MIIISNFKTFLAQATDHSQVYNFLKFNILMLGALMIRHLLIQVALTFPDHHYCAFGMSGVCLLDRSWI
jgi:hypothetical protein